MKRPVIITTLAILTIVLIHACSSTIRTVDTSLVTITIGDGQKTATVRAEKATPWARLLHFFAGAKLTPKAHAAIPAAVKVVVVTVSAPDMKTMVTVVPVVGQPDIAITIEVPNGRSRNFLVEGFDASSTVIYRGQASVDLKGDPVLLTISLASVVADALPPTFNGLSLVSNVTATTAQLSWSAAADNVTPSANIVYLIYQATTAGGEVYTSPTYTTPAGATSFTVAGLAEGTTYYFVVRARDAAGNRDNNVIERSGTTPDVTPPAFAGLTTISNVTGTTAQLTWSAATDTITPSSGIVYLIYRASSPSGESYASPTYVTAAGATNYTVTDLTPATTYYFVVRARDAAGNIDSNTIERTTSTPDTLPPAFAGLSLVTNVSYTTMQLSWSPAADNVTPTANIAYLVYQSTMPGGGGYVAPTYTTVPNAFGYRVTGLTPGATYYFVVRARDAAGNIDTNTVERTAAYPGLHVNAVSGDDLNSGSQAAPFRTITKALSVTLGSEAIFVSQGTYSYSVVGGPGSETFPLQLKTGTALVCTGTNRSTVIDDAGSTAPGASVIVGEQGAVIDGCTVDSQTPVYQAAVSDGGFDMTITNCSLISHGMVGRSQGVTFSGKSTLVDSLMQDIVNDGVGSGVDITGGSALITRNTITGNYHGVRINAGNATIDTNTIVGNSNNGVYVQGGTALVNNNVIESNLRGIMVSMVSPTITNNMIRKNWDGIAVFGSAGTSPKVNSNYIYCNTNFDLDATGAMDPFNATNNTWDHAPPNAIIPSVAACPAGTDICYYSPGPTFTPYNTAAPDACSP